MARGNFIKFLLNEEITVGGKPMKDDDEKEPNYSGGGDEETPKEDPPADPPATDPAPDNTEEPTPDYTGDSPDGGGEENPEPNPEPEPDATTADGNTPEDNNPTPDPEEPEPDYNTDPENPDGNGEETPDPGIEDGDGEEPEPDYNTDPENPDKGTPEENPDGNGEETPDYNTDPENPDGNGEDNPDGTEDPNNPDGAEDPNNPDGEEGDPDYAAGGNGEDTGDGTADASDTIDGSITQMQTDVFSNLTPNQIALKIKELKTQYVNLFSDINGIIERLSQITRKEDNIDTLQFVSKKFLELKDMVKDSLVYSFDDNSYVQNQITLKEFFAIYVNLITLIEKLGEGQDKK